MKLYVKLLPAMVLVLANLPTRSHSPPLREVKLQAARDSFTVNVQGKVMQHSMGVVLEMRQSSIDFRIFIARQP
jgi:hypothetical protein